METQDIPQKEMGRGSNNSKDFTPINKERFLNVDFLRFISAIMVFGIHIVYARLGKLSPSFEVYKENTINGFIAVSFFFIMAGFFLAYTFKQKTSVMDFIKNKIARLWPLIAFVVLLDFIGSCFHLIKFKFYDNIFALLFLSNSGITFTEPRAEVWFLSVLFLVSVFYFYIFKYFNKTVYNFFIPVTVLLCSTFMVHATHGRCGGHLEVYYNFLNMGIIRGIAGMGLGYMVYEFYQYLKTQPFVNSIKSVIVYSLFEGYLLGFIIYETIFHKMHFQNRMILIVAFTALFLLFLLKRGFVSRLFDIKLSAVLGRYAFAIYMTHSFIYTVLYQLWIKSHIEIISKYPLATILILFAIVFVFSIFTYHFVEVPAGKYLKKKFFPEKA